MSGIIINEDNSHYFYDRGLAGASIEKLKEMVSHYCLDQVDEVMYCFMAQRSNTVGLNVEPIWDGMEEKEDGLYFRGKRINPAYDNWIFCAKKLHDQGIDPYEVWLDETRKLGRRATLSMRMNDCHDIEDKDHFFHAEFWRKHPEFHLDPVSRDAGYPAFWISALDYTFEEVREYKMNIIRAVFDRYDMDAFEIDWMRHGNNVGMNNIDAGREAITEFHRQVRALADQAAKRLGHPVDIAVRVSSTPDDAFNRGLDVAAWVREGLVQSVIPTAFWATSDTGMPIALWRSILGSNATLCAGLELLIRPYPESDFILETSAFLAGQAADYFYQGADKIYLFNHMDSDTAMEDKDEYYDTLNTVGTAETAAAAHRRHVLTFQDTSAFGKPVPNALPAYLPGNWFSNYLRLSIGPKPEPGRKCRLILGFNTADVPDFEIWLNTRPLTLTRIFENKRPEENEQAFGSLQPVKIPESSVVCAEFDATDAVVSGSNIIILKNKEEKSCSVTWVEFDIEA